MYLPTFWKLTMEAYGFRYKQIAGYGVPIFIWVTWLMYPSIYNWVYSDIYPPERGVRKR